MHCFPVRTLRALLAVGLSPASAPVLERAPVAAQRDHRLKDLTDDDGDVAEHDDTSGPPLLPVRRSAPHRQARAKLSA